MQGRPWLAMMKLDRSLGYESYEDGDDRLFAITRTNKGTHLVGGQPHNSGLSVCERIVAPPNPEDITEWVPVDKFRDITKNPDLPAYERGGPLCERCAKKFFGTAWW